MNESFLCLGNFGMVTGSATARAQGTEEGSSAVEVVPTMLDAWRGNQPHLQTRVGRVSGRGQDKVQCGDLKIPGDVLRDRLWQTKVLQRVPERGGTGWQVFQSGIHEERESIGRASGGVDINMGYLRTDRREGGPRSL